MVNADLRLVCSKTRDIYSNGLALDFKALRSPNYDAANPRTTASTGRDQGISLSDVHVSAAVLRWLSLFAFSGWEGGGRSGEVRVGETGAMQY